MALIEVYRKDAMGRMVSEGALDLTKANDYAVLGTAKRHGLRLMHRPGRGMRNNFYGTTLGNKSK